MEKGFNEHNKKGIYEIRDMDKKKRYLKDFYKSRESSSMDSMYIFLYLTEEKRLLENVIIRDINECYEASNCLVYHLDILEKGNNYFIEYKGEIEKSGEEILGDLKNLLEIKSSNYEIHLYIDIKKFETEMEFGINLVEDEFELTEDYFYLLKEQYKFYREIDKLLDFYSFDNDILIHNYLIRIEEIKKLLELRTNYKKEVGKYLLYDLEHYN